MLYSLPGKAWPKHYKTKMVLELCFRFPSVSTAHFDSFTIKFTKKIVYIYIYAPTYYKKTQDIGLHTRYS